MSLQASSSTRPTTDTDNSTRTNYVAIPLSLRDLIFQREAIHVVLQTVGALCFCVGSIFFLPALEHYFTVGLWLFVAGLVGFIVVSIHELSRGFSFVSHAYLVRSIVFGAGCTILFLPSIALATAGAWCFVVGSVVFFRGCSRKAVFYLGKPKQHSILLGSTCNMFQLDWCHFIPDRFLAIFAYV
jgi:hypothetical protein